MIVAVVLSLLFLTRLRQWGLIRVTSWIALTVILTGSVVWPWYLVWPTLLFAAAGVAAERLLVVLWSVVLLFTTLPGGHSGRRAVLPPAHRPDRAGRPGGGGPRGSGPRAAGRRRARPRAEPAR